MAPVCSGASIKYRHTPRRLNNVLLETVSPTQLIVYVYDYSYQPAVDTGYAIEK